MKQFNEYIAMILVSLLATVWGVCSLMYGEEWKVILGGVCASLLGPLLAFAMAYCLHRDWKNGTLFPEKLKPQEHTTGIELAAELPLALLAERFRELAPKDELLNADEPDSFLGWKTYGDGDFHLFPDGLDEGQGWHALWWGRSIAYAREPSGGAALRAARSLECMSDSEVEAVCCKHDVPVQSCYLNMQPNGLAFYREGKLTIYPATCADAFRDSFMSTILAPEKDFRDWAEWNDAEEEEEETAEI